MGVEGDEQKMQLLLVTSLMDILETFFGKYKI